MNGVYNQWGSYTPFGIATVMENKAKLLTKGRNTRIQNNSELQLIHTYCWVLTLVLKILHY